MLARKLSVIVERNSIFIEGIENIVLVFFPFEPRGPEFPAPFVGYHFSGNGENLMEFFMRGWFPAHYSNPAGKPIKRCYSPADHIQGHEIRLEMMPDVPG